MLVLTRKCGESIVIPECEVVVTVLKMSGRRVRIGVSAPEDKSVFRSEYAERLARRVAMDQLSQCNADACDGSTVAEECLGSERGVIME